MKQIIIPGKRKGIITIPASKSDTQRSLLAAAMAKGVSTLHNVGNSSDETGMLETIQVLGASVKHLNGKTLQIEGIKQFPENAIINIRESGLGCRLITSVCASRKGVFRIEGKGSLLTRPMPFFESVLTQLGAKVTSTNGYIPLVIEGPMTGGSVTFDGSDSSQYLSGLLMAAAYMQGGTTHITVEKLNSLPYVQMTLNTMKQFGIIVQHQNFKEYIIGGHQQYIACEYTIESDWSSASFWLVASALGMDIELSGLSLSSLQADKQILKAFEAANCFVEFNENRIRINGNVRKAFHFDATDCPDLFPALATFASLCDGITTIKGVSRLTHKESNRGVVLKEEFEKLGVNIILDDDYMHIHGKTFIEGGKTKSHNDHRIAMCLGIAGLYADDPIEIEGVEAVGKSYPEFWQHLEQLTKVEDE